MSTTLPLECAQYAPSSASSPSGAAYWDLVAVHELIVAEGGDQAQRTTERLLDSSGLLPKPLKLADIASELGEPANKVISERIDAEAKRKRTASLVVQSYEQDDGAVVVMANDGRLGRRWVVLDQPLNEVSLRTALTSLCTAKKSIVWPHGSIVPLMRELVTLNSGRHDIELTSDSEARLATFAYGEPPIAMIASDVAHSALSPKANTPANSTAMSHLDLLEAESIHIMREVVAQADNPVMLYSIGKDSAVMLHLAQKAFYPSPPPFPLMHVDTRWKFKAMYELRDQMAQRTGMELICHTNPEGVEKDINPFDHGSALHTDVMKTQGLKQALDKHGFDVAFGGARRDEEKSRAKERVFSFRTTAHRWDPKNQRPELWNLYNAHKQAGESIRAFPLSNWTELDIWEYIYRERVPLVPLYYAAERPVVERDGMLIMVDDDRMRLYPDEAITLKQVRFRTLGCYPLTGAVESAASDLAAIVLELLQSTTSERQGRAIDSDSAASMETKKQEGYF